MRNISLTLGLLSLACAWLLPGHYPPFLAYQQQLLAGLGGLLLGLAAITGAGYPKIRWPWLGAAVGIFAIVPLCQLLSGQIRYVSDGILSAFYLIGFALSVSIGATLAGKYKAAWVDGLMASMGCAATMSAVIALHEWLELKPTPFFTAMPPGGRPYGNLAQPNHLATLLALGVISLIWFFLRRRIGATLCAVCVALLGMAMIATQSRTGWLFVGLLFFWHVAMRRRASLTLSRRAVVIWVLVFAGGVALWTPMNRALMLPSGYTIDRLQTGLRGSHWVVLLDALRRAPWTGYGWQQVTFAQQAAALAHPPTHEMIQDSHNTILDLMLWMGIPLGGMLAAAVIVWLVTRVSRCHDFSTWSLLGAVGAILTHAMLEYPLAYAYFLIPLGLLMGSVDGLSNLSPILKWRNSSLAAPLFGMLVFFLWIGKECIELESSGRGIRLAIAGFGTGSSPSALPDVIVLDGPREFYRFMLTPATRHMTDKQLEWMRDAARRNPIPPALLRYALADGLNGRPAEAENTLELLCSLYDEAQCRGALVAWTELQSTYPVLTSISMPIGHSGTGN